MTKFVVALILCAFALASGCGRTDDTRADNAPSGVASITSPEGQAVAEQLLGSGAEVLASGDLAGTGRRQVLVVNRTAPKQKMTSAVVFSRAAVLEQRGSKWDEVLLCDEYLKNPKGFLGGAPLAQVTAWRLQFGSHMPGGKVGEFDFTPLQPDGTGYPTIIVRWNPKADRYQSFDPATGQFLNEMMSLETPRSELR
jgi:hypothetical protein